MSAFQSTKCSNVLKSDKYGKCTHTHTRTQSADTYVNAYTHTLADTLTLPHTDVLISSLDRWVKF